MTFYIKYKGSFPTHCCGLVLEQEWGADNYPVLIGSNPILRVEIRAYLGSRQEGKYRTALLKWDGLYSMCGSPFREVYGAEETPEQVVATIEKEIAPQLLAIASLLDWAKSVQIT